MTIRIECDSCHRIFENVPPDAPWWSCVEFRPLLGAKGAVWLRAWCAECTKAAVQHGANLEDAQREMSGWGYEGATA